MRPILEVPVAESGGKEILKGRRIMSNRDTSTEVWELPSSPMMEVFRRRGDGSQGATIADQLLEVESMDNCSVECRKET